MRQLKNLLTSAGSDPSDCIEKRELIAKAAGLGLSNPGRQSVSAKTTPVFEPVMPSLLPNGRLSKKSGGKVGVAVLAELSRIEEVVGRKNFSPFDVLGVAESDGLGTVRSRAKQLFRQVHPDKVHSDDPAVKRRAQNVFQAITAAVDQAVELLGKKNFPSPSQPAGLQYSVERAGTVILLRWKSGGGQSTGQFRVWARLGHSPPIDQGVIANLPNDHGELEYAISAQSRAGNDELFRRARFEVGVMAVCGSVEGPPATIPVDLTRVSGSGLKRHHTIC